MVIEAVANDLKPVIDAQRRLMARWLAGDNYLDRRSM
jgi:hypothetical protein